MEKVGKETDDVYMCLLIAQQMADVNTGYYVTSLELCLGDE